MTNPISDDDIDYDARCHQLAPEIRSWDRREIRNLRDLLAELSVASDLIDRHAEDYVDLAALPSVPIPDDVDTAYPVWAMDKHGAMLVGDSAADVESLEWYRASTAV